MKKVLLMILLLSINLKGEGKESYDYDFLPLGTSLDYLVKEGGLEAFLNKYGIPLKKPAKIVYLEDLQQQIQGLLIYHTPEIQERLRTVIEPLDSKMKYHVSVKFKTLEPENYSALKFQTLLEAAPHTYSMGKKIVTKVNGKWAQKYIGQNLKVSVMPSSREGHVTLKGKLWVSSLAKDDTLIKNETTNSSRIKKARKLFLDADFEQARILASAFLQENPEDIDAINLLCQIKDCQNKLRHLSTGVNVLPEDPEISLIKLKDVTVSEALRFLRIETKRQNFVFHNELWDADKSRKVSIISPKLSTFRFLDELHKQAGIRWLIYQNKIVLRPYFSENLLFNKYYPITSAKMLDEISGEGLSFKDGLARHGITFPPESRAQFTSHSMGFWFRNTRANHYKLRKFLHGFAGFYNFPVLFDSSLLETNESMEFTRELELQEDNSIKVSCGGKIYSFDLSVQILEERFAPTKNRIPEIEEHDPFAEDDPFAEL